MAHHAGGNCTVITLEDECWPWFNIVALDVDLDFSSPFLVMVTFFDKNQEPVIWYHGMLATGAAWWAIYVDTCIINNNAIQALMDDDRPWF